MEAYGDARWRHMRRRKPERRIAIFGHTMWKTIVLVLGGPPIVCLSRSRESASEFHRARGASLRVSGIWGPTHSLTSRRSSPLDERAFDFGGDGLVVCACADSPPTCCRGNGPDRLPLEVSSRQTIGSMGSGLPVKGTFPPRCSVCRAHTRPSVFSTLVSPEPAALAATAQPRNCSNDPT